MQAISNLSVLPLYVQARLILTYFDSKIPQVKTCPINLRRQKCNMSQVHSFLGQPDLWHHCRQALHPQKEPRSQQENRCPQHICTAEFTSFPVFPTLGFHTKSGLLIATSFASARISGSLSFPAAQWGGLQAAGTQYAIPGRACMRPAVSTRTTS